VSSQRFILELKSRNSSAKSLHSSRTFGGGCASGTDALLLTLVAAEFSPATASHYSI